MSKPVYIVVGTPSGGTSAVAGVLRKLCVSMFGDEFIQQAFDTPKPRPQVWWWHDTCECLAALAIADRYWPMNEISPTGDPKRAVSDLHRYVQMRRESGDEFVGFKETRIAAILSLPGGVPPDVHLIEVARPLQDVARSWWDKRRVFGASTEDQRRAVAFIAQLWLLKESLCHAVKPLAIVHYDDLIDNPEEEIHELARAMNLIGQDHGEAVKSINDYRSKEPSCPI